MTRRYDLRIVNAIIADGSGGTPYRGDIGIIDGKLAAVGVAPGTAATTLDAEPAAGPAQPGRFAIQVAAYDRQAQAAALADRLTEQSYPSYVARSTDLEGRILFRVRIGAYPDRRAAEEAGQRVTADEGLEWYVVQAP